MEENSTFIAGGKEGMDRVPNLVSVVIPAYNAQQSLGRCIDHVLAQTFPSIQIIVVNDGSKDQTEAVVKSYGEKIVYVSQSNQGETAARNAGFALARGEFVTFIDHDDYWDLRFVEKTVRFLKDNRRAVAVSAGQRCYSALSDKANVRPEFLEDEAMQEQTPRVLEDFFGFWWKQNHICAGSAMLRGTLLDQAGGQRTDLVLSGDMEFWAYLATFGTWGFIPEVLLTVDGTQVSRGNLYRKFHDRYLRCTTVEDWESRIVPRLKEGDWPGFCRVRGRVATWFVFAHVFVGRDGLAKACASRYRNELEGAFGRLWRLGLTAGWLSWKPLCLAMRLRTRLQYQRADRRSS
jgi:hypothetical protein